MAKHASSASKIVTLLVLILLGWIFWHFAPMFLPRYRWVNVRTDVIAKEAPLSAKRCTRVVMHIARALAEAHRQDIVHRDLKPDNIMLVPHGGEPDFLKVLDFGVAKLKKKSDAPPTATQTSADVILGTPKYMAPEQINGVSDDVRSDLYALGAIWYELLTGWTPFDGDSAVKILMKHLQEEPPALKEMNPDCKASQLQEDLVHQLLSKDPMHRPQSAHQLLEMLEDLPEYTGPRTRLATQAGFMPAVNIPLPADERSDATRVGEAPVSKAAAGSRRDVPMVSQGTASRVRPVPSGGGSRAQNSAVRFPTQEVTMAQSNTGARPAVKSAVAPVASNKDPASDPQISQVFTHTNMRKAEVVAEPTPAPMPAPTPVRPSQTTSAAGAARRDTLPDDLPAVGRSMVPHFVGGILLTLGLGTGGYVVFRPSHSSQQLQRVEQPPTPPKPVADPAPVPAEAKKVTITVTSQPVKKA